MHRDSTVLELEAYEQEAFASDATQTSLSGTKATTSVSLSPFHVPDGVDLKLQPDGSCVFSFVYANSEHQHRVTIAMLGDRVVEVALGRHSGKVLEVRFKSARNLFNPAAPYEPLAPVLRALGDRSPHSRSVAERHVMLIDRIIEFAIRELRPQVLAALASESAAIEGHG